MAMLPCISTKLDRLGGVEREVREPPLMPMILMKLITKGKMDAMIALMVDRRLDAAGLLPWTMGNSHGRRPP
jgi:hypothetical protein